MLKKYAALLMVLHCVLAKSIAAEETAEVPIERSSVHFSYGLSPVQMFAVPQIPINKMTDHVFLHNSRPVVHFYHAVPTSSHIGYVNAIPNPAYVSVLNNPKIKSSYSFIFSSPHHVKFHDNHDQYEAKMEVMNTHVHVETLQGNFEDFIKKEEPSQPENFYGHAVEVKPLINTVESVAIDVTEATTLATTRESTMTTPSITQKNEAKLESGVKTNILNVETLHGKFEDFIQKDSPPFDNGHSDEINPSVHPIESANIDVTAATMPVATQATTGTVLTPSSSEKNQLKGNVEYDIDIRKDDE